jgi:hypothetical protein
VSTSLAEQTAAWKTQSQAAQNGIGAFIRFDFPGYTLRLFTGAGEIDWDDGSGDETWTGAPMLQLGSISGNSRVEAGAISISLSGLDGDIRDEVFEYAVRGSKVYVWFFYVNAGAIVADPWLAFAGSLDVPTIEEGATLTVTMDCLDALGAAFRRTVTRRTDADQQRRYAGDRFFEFAASIARQPVRWGVPWENGVNPGVGGNWMREGGRYELRLD